MHSLTTSVGNLKKDMFMLWKIYFAWHCCTGMELLSFQTVQRSAEGDTQVKKRQQAIVGFLEANRISFEEVDITMLENRRLWMYRNIPEEKRPEKGNPLPPQIFNGDDYCGDYEDFFQSKEMNTVFSFLRLPPVKDSES
ncbi:SH3 domain-binding glutamic acid-rich-like protein 2 isoform X2 [Sinocyclocheilus grahami]|uniref:SH3 domain-binding glutamic acid-rich-like protein 2 n=1 Tax=Sinocyclocheilus grahami TaxID=75366 RepID=A0A672NBF3_SINGR|nr:PREDICTED: SH3 domain-binding glutamic acid-rich-like protein 2 isoform X2 [Sinocyclocheilus grahami]